MSRCLTDRTLLELHYGESSGDARAHMAECESCAARYQGLHKDLNTIGQVLRQEPPPRRAREPGRRFVVGWLPRAVALAMALLLAWAGMRAWIQGSRPPVEVTTNGESRSFLDELPANPFLLTEALALELATAGPGFYDLAATLLEAERPCEWYDAPATDRAEPLVGDAEFPGGMPFVTCVEIDQNQ